MIAGEAILMSIKEANSSFILTQDSD